VSPTIPAGRGPSAPTLGTLQREAVRSISSEELFAGQRMIVIRHGKEEYRLQVTGTGKLILTK
jgi:hemin uptake protein HemP